MFTVATALITGGRGWLRDTFARGKGGPWEGRAKKSRLK
jgi:hypothetical protein